MSELILLAAIEAEQQIIDQLEKIEENKPETELEIKLRLLRQKRAQLEAQTSSLFTPGVKDESNRDNLVKRTPPTPSSKSSKSKMSKRREIKRLLKLDSDYESGEDNDDDDSVALFTNNKPNKLDDKNWKTWKESAISALETKNLWQFGVHGNSCHKFFVSNAEIAGLISSHLINILHLIR